jgi:hypothetical protein
MRVVFFILFSFSVSFLNAQKADKIAIKAVIQSAYVDGLFNKGDTLAIQKGFHPSFRLLGQAEGGKMRELFIAEWIEIVKKRIADGAFPAKKEKEVTVKFLKIDVVENVAMVKLVFLVGGKKSYIDFISLYKYEDGWKLVNKVYHKMP